MSDFHRDRQLNAHLDSQEVCTGCDLDPCECSESEPDFEAMAEARAERWS